jgi:hypothetical protein
MGPRMFRFSPRSMVNEKFKKSPLFLKDLAKPETVKTTFEPSLNGGNFKDILFSRT